MADLGAAERDAPRLCQSWSFVAADGSCRVCRVLNGLASLGGFQSDFDAALSLNYLP